MKLMKVSITKKILLFLSTEKKFHFIVSSFLLDGTSRSNLQPDMGGMEQVYNSFIQNALGGFVFVLAEDGQCLYVSSNVSEFLGLQQVCIQLFLS